MRNFVYKIFIAQGHAANQQVDAVTSSMYDARPRVDLRCVCDCKGKPELERPTKFLRSIDERTVAMTATETLIVTYQSQFEDSTPIHQPDDLVRFFLVLAVYCATS